MQNPYHAQEFSNFVTLYLLVLFVNGLCIHYMLGVFLARLTNLFYSIKVHYMLRVKLCQFQLN